MSIREAAREFGLHRNTVRKMLAYSVPPGYRRETPPRRPKLEAYSGVIDQILEKDHSVPKKQRHTAKRIFERRASAGRVRVWRRVHHGQGLRQGAPPPDAGDVRALVPSAGTGPVRLRRGSGHNRRSGAESSLPHLGPAPQRRLLRQGLSRGDHDAILDGHNSAFAFVGGVPQSDLYDNAKLAVAKIEGEGRRQPTRPSQDR